MRYYVVADTHGFFTEMIDALNEKGFFEDNEPHNITFSCMDGYPVRQVAMAVERRIICLCRIGETQAR